MSFYATIAGEAVYEKQEDFDAAVKTLTDGDWVKDRVFLDEEGAVVRVDDGQDIIPTERRIVIPLAHWRNLARLLNKGQDCYDLYGWLFRGICCH